MKSLYDRMMGWRLHQQHKHDQSAGAAVGYINAMTNEEFLMELSGDLDDMFKEFREELQGGAEDRS